MTDQAGKQSNDEAGPEAERPVDLAVDGHGDPDAPSPSAGLEGWPAKWRIAESLETLRRQINALAPGRDKASDGGIGDVAHQNSKSDHNPSIMDGAVGVVTARDFTHSPATGCDAGVLVEALRLSRDARIKYMIWNKRICASTPQGGQPAWAWRPYAGKNGHTKHAHVSVMPSKALYDDTRPFALASVKPGAAAVPIPPPEPAAPTVATGPASVPEMEAIATAAERLSGLVPLVERLTDMTDCSDPTVAREAGELLARYAAAVRAQQVDTPRPAAPPVAVAATDPLSFEALKSGYETLYATCKVRPEWAGQVTWHRNRLVKNRARYEEVQTRTGVPWWFVGIVHALEASFDFGTHLHNGDPLTARTVQVPKGRPLIWNPPNDWVSSAVDALEHDGLSGQTDWSTPRALHRFERYNGFGSRKKGINSPYLWSFSNHYTKGKFVRDGVYDPEAVSKQCGAAVMLLALAEAGDLGSRT